MRVLADVTCLRTGSTGVSRYARSLLSALEAQGVEVARFSVGRGSEPLPDRSRHFNLPLRAAHLLWQHTSLLKAEDLCGMGDVVHTLDLVPAPTDLASVLTVHDLAAIDLPSEHPRRAVAIQRRQVGAARCAGAVVAVSGTVRDALTGQHGVDPENVFVVPHGVQLAPAADDVLVTGRFFLAVGALHPRKGLHQVITALRRLPDDVRLVHVGPTGPAATELAALAERVGVQHRVVRLGRIDDDALARLYVDCVALVFPSIAEGFGLPVLECLAAGSPVIASDLPALREAGGTVAHYVRAADGKAWCDAMMAHLSEPNLADRAATEGPHHARAFTWREAARKTVAAYQHAIDRSADRGPSH